MSLLSKDIHIGSGTIYAVPYTGVIPSDTSIEKTQYQLGYISGGSTLVYNAVKTEYKDIYGVTQKVALTSESAQLQVSFITWDGVLISKLVASTVVEDEDTRTVSVGGLETDSVEKWVIRFKSSDGKNRLTLVAFSSEGIIISSQASNAGLLSATFKALQVDGRLFIYTEGDITPQPTYNLDIDENGTYHVESYDTVEVNVPTGSDISDTTAVASDVISGKVFHVADGTTTTGTMANKSGTTTVLSSSNFVQSGSNILIKNLGSGYYDGTTQLKLQGDVIGTAAASEVLAGKTFTSSAGVCVEGTFDPTANLGNATADKVLSGYTFSSSSGVLQTGTFASNAKGYQGGLSMSNYNGVTFPIGFQASVIEWQITESGTLKYIGIYDTRNLTGKYYYVDVSAGTASLKNVSATATGIGELRTVTATEATFSSRPGFVIKVSATASI